MGVELYSLHGLRIIGHTVEDSWIEFQLEGGRKITIMTESGCNILWDVE